MKQIIDVNNRQILILKSFADLNSQRLALNPTTAWVSALGIGYNQGDILFHTELCMFPLDGRVFIQEDLERNKNLFIFFFDKVRSSMSKSKGMNTEGDLL